MILKIFKNMIIGIDFDGTCTTHEFPKIGKDIGAIPILKRLVSAGHQLLLFTMRSDMNNVKAENDPEIIGVSGNYLSEAVQWFKDNNIPLWAKQINPTQSKWTTSPKAYCQLYIDDAALGCPLIINKNISANPYVDWIAVEKMLIQRRIL